MLCVCYFSPFYMKIHREKKINQYCNGCKWKKILQVHILCNRLLTSVQWNGKKHGCYMLLQAALKTYYFTLYKWNKNLLTHYSTQTLSVLYIPRLNVKWSTAAISCLLLNLFLVRAHFQEHSWSLIIRGHGSHLGDGDVGLEALDFHIIWFDRQVCLAVRDVEGARGRALCLGQLVLLLACLALCGSRLKNSGISVTAQQSPSFDLLLNWVDDFIKSQNI